MRRYETLIEAADLAERIDRTVVVDCRFSLSDPEQGRREYLEGHIPTAVYAHLDDDLAGPITAESGRHPLPSAEAFVQTLRSWGISNDSQVVVYDGAGGAIAARLWWMLRWLGHDAVAVLNGGYAAWTACSLPTSTAAADATAGTFSGRPDDSRTIAVDAVQTALEADTDFALVDARDAARFRGEVEPIDRIAGHVPGALNLPFSELLTADGRFRARDELNNLWNSVLDGEREDWAVMCGSGVTACHLALGAQISGLSPPRLYVGSWSEWSRDPARKVARADEA